MGTGFGSSDPSESLGDPDGSEPPSRVLRSFLKADRLHSYDSVLLDRHLFLRNPPDLISDRSGSLSRITLLLLVRLNCSTSLSSAIRLKIYSISLQGTSPVRFGSRLRSNIEPSIWVRDESKSEACLPLAVIDLKPLEYRSNGIDCQVSPVKTRLSCIASPKEDKTVPVRNGINRANACKNPPSIFKL